MKKSFALFFTATVLPLFGLFTVSAAAYTFTPGSEAVVYVDGAAGSNSNTGASASAAVQTLDQAYALLRKSGGGTLVVSGAVSVPGSSFAPASTDGAVLYTSVYGGVDYRTQGAALKVAAHMAFNNDTYFDDIRLEIEKSNLILSGRYHNFGIGAGVDCVSTASAPINFPLLVGGYNDPATIAMASTDKSYTLTVAGGAWQGLMGGNRRGSSTKAIGVLSGDIAVLIEGGVFDKGSGSQYVSASGACFHMGRLYMEITGGTFNEDIYIYRRLGTLPSDASLKADSASKAQTVVRLLGGNFNGSLFTANETPGAAEIWSDVCIVVTDAAFSSASRLYNRGVLGSVVIRCSAETEAALLAHCDGAFLFSNSLDSAAGATTTAHFSGWVNSLQDPYVVEKDGVFYYCFSSGASVNGVTYPGIKIAASTEILFSNMSYNSVSVFNAAKTDIPNAKKEYWAPEMHYFSAEEVGAADAGWYIYFAADDGENANHRMYVLRASDPEDPTSTYSMVGQLVTDEDKWAIDGTVLKYGGKLYFVWSGWPGDVNGCQNLYIQEMENPYTMKTGKRVLISTPTYDWETKDRPLVNEGPQALVLDGTTHIVYSASGSWGKNYCLGVLTLTGDDPLVASNWYKHPKTVFSSDAGASRYGTGHSSYVQNYHDGSFWMYFHANPSLTVSAGSSWWADREVYAQPFTVKEVRINGKTYSFPDFGTPLAPSAARGVTVTSPDFCAGGHWYGGAGGVCRICGAKAPLTGRYKDVNGDGCTNTLDALIVMRWMRTGERPASLDDVLWILRYAAGTLHIDR